MFTLSSIRRFELSHLVVLAIFAWPATGGAQPAAVATPGTPSAGAGAPSADPLARARFEQGVAAFDQGRFREAVELFKQADRLAPSPLHSFNVAKVCERMGDNPGALAAYREYLRRLPGAQNTADVRERVADLERSLKATGVQQLSVLSSPAGATVLIDDVTRGISPWTGELTPGRHLLALRLGGYRDKVSEIELPAERAIDVEVKLESSVPAAAPPARETKAPLAPSARPAVSANLGARNEPPLAEQPPRVPRWWTWVMFGGSAAAFAGAGIFEVTRSNLEDEARQAPVQTDAVDTYASMERHQTAARVFAGVGVLAALAGGVSLFFDVRHANTAPTDLAFGCASEGCSLAARGQF